MDAGMNTTPHHIGCAVRHILDSANTYAHALGLQRRTRTFDVKSQGVRICFVELRERFYLELVEPISSPRGLDNFIKVGFYHLCFLAEDIDEARAFLKVQRFTPMNPFQSEAFDGAVCQFFLSPQLHLIEVAQISSNHFEQLFLNSLEIQ